MEKFSKIREPVEIKIYPYMMDHKVEGKPVLPAVEAMQILAACVKKYLPDININCMIHAEFKKFLYIKPDEPKIDLFIDIEADDSGNIISKLISISKIGNITRPKEHVRLLFPGYDMETSGMEISHFSFPISHFFEIYPDKIYQQLVPFGPAYQNITRLHICEKGAVAYIKSGTLFPAVSGSHCTLGSPFPLDAAFHAACVWGQRYAGIIGFPVGFQKRLILKLTHPEETYLCKVLPAEKINPKAFTVNLWIYDLDNTLCEEISGVQMQDVSGGRMTPPQFIRP